MNRGQRRSQDVSLCRRLPSLACSLVPSPAARRPPRLNPTPGLTARLARLSSPGQGPKDPAPLGAAQLSPAARSAALLGAAQPRARVPLTAIDCHCHAIAVAGLCSRVLEPSRIPPPSPASAGIHHRSSPLSRRCSAAADSSFRAYPSRALLTRPRASRAHGT